MRGLDDLLVDLHILPHNTASLADRRGTNSRPYTGALLVHFDRTTQLEVHDDADGVIGRLEEGLLDVGVENFCVSRSEQRGVTSSTSRYIPRFGPRFGLNRSPLTCVMSMPVTFLPPRDGRICKSRRRNSKRRSAQSIHEPQLLQQHHRAYGTSVEDEIGLFGELLSSLEVNLPLLDTLLQLLYETKGCSISSVQCRWRRKWLWCSTNPWRGCGRRQRAP